MVDVSKNLEMMRLGGPGLLSPVTRDVTSSITCAASSSSVLFSPQILFPPDLTILRPFSSHPSGPLLFTDNATKSSFIPRCQFLF